MTDSPVADAPADDRPERQSPTFKSRRGLDISGLQSQIHLAWLVVPCLTADALMVPAFATFNGPPTVFGAAIAFGIVGCVLAQGNLLAAWAAWGDRPFPRRQLTHWKIAGGLFAIWLVGLRLAVPLHDEPQLAAATVALGVPLISLAAQLPLWIARHWLGWRLVRVIEGETPPRERPLSIRDLLVATLVVAASLALARLSPIFFENPQALWPAWGIACMVASLISSIAILPAGALLLRWRPLSRGLKSSALYAAAWIALVWILVALLRWFSVNLPPRALFVGLSSLMFTFAATITLTAVIARSRGVRLTSRRDRSATGSGPFEF
jgi:hypothetical protein